MNTLCHANRCGRLLPILRGACFIASAALLSMSCRFAAAQAPQPDNLRTTTESRRSAPSDARGPQSGEKSVKQLLQLKERLLQLSQGEQNDRTKDEMANIIDAIAATSARVEVTQLLAEKKPDLSAQVQQLKQLQEQFAQQQKFLAEREKQYATMLVEQRRPPLPPLENGSVKIFRLENARARDAALTIESLFGTQSLRVAVDDRSNTLLGYGKPEVLATLEAILTRLDEQASPGGNQKSKAGTLSPRSLMLRVFWLADSVPDNYGENPSDYLPKSVLAATQKLLTGTPRMVTQTVTSLATGKDDAVDFAMNVPVLLMEQPVGMGCQGKVKLVADDRVRVDMEVHIGGKTMNSDLQGSMATPLGHYMVLGTANTMIAEGGPMTGGMPGGPGMGMGPGGGFAQPVREFGGPEGGAAPDPAPGPGGVQPGPGFGAARGMASAPPAKQKYEMSRFAFVVQVIESQSYASEKAKPEGK